MAWTRDRTGSMVKLKISAPWKQKSPLISIHQASRFPATGQVSQERCLGVRGSWGRGAGGGSAASGVEKGT